MHCHNADEPGEIFSQVVTYLSVHMTKWFSCTAWPVKIGAYQYVEPNKELAAPPDQRHREGDKWTRKKGMNRLFICLFIDNKPCWRQEVQLEAQRPSLLYITLYNAYVYDHKLRNYKCACVRDCVWGVSDWEARHHRGRLKKKGTIMYWGDFLSWPLVSCGFQTGSNDDSAELWYWV